MKEITIKIASTQEEIQEARDIRNSVFILEQGIPREMDLDDDEERSVHLLAMTQGVNSKCIATGRLTIQGDTGIVSRIAVINSFRNRGIGKLILSEIETIAKQKNLTKLTLTPHDYLENFYSSLGYKKIEGEKVVGKYRLLFMAKLI